MGIEATIEKAAREHIEAMGGRLIKFVSPGYKGVPDRLVCHPNTTPFLMEFKSPGCALRDDQVKTCAELARAGMRIYAGDFRRGKWWGVNSIIMAQRIIDDEIEGFGESRYGVFSA